ncbi:C4-type zinc ribbon domain-containing protein [Sporichthya brevicatena]|uniref:C4-type zinc ribbon domain-containing protein n=1 Tax=Sporichthya brevicatena TaxID=171442 RepID=A0ABP3SBB7_9ACTN
MGDRTLQEDPLNVALADQWRLLDLQALDTRIDQLAHRRRTLPETATIAELAVRRDQVRDLLVAAETEDSDIARDQTKAEADVDQVRQRAERDQKRLDAGQVSSPKELESLQHEIASLAKRQADLEDAVLEIMERREAAQARIAELTAERDRIAADLERTEAALAAATAEIDAETEKVGGERATLAGGLPGELVALYEKVRASSNGLGAAALRRGRCEGCRMELSTTDLNKVRATPEDEVVRCEECRRILVRVADSGL